MFYRTMLPKVGGGPPFLAANQLQLVAKRTLISVLIFLYWFCNQKIALNTFTVTQV